MSAGGCSAGAVGCPEKVTDPEVTVDARAAVAPAANEHRLWGVKVPRCHAICHMGEKSYLRGVHQAFVANGTQVRHHAPLRAHGAPPRTFSRLVGYHGCERAANHVADATPARRRAAVPRGARRVRVRKRGTSKAGLLARRRTLVDALFQQAVDARLHNARAHNATVFLGFAKPAQTSRLTCKVCLRVVVSLLEGLGHRTAPKLRRHKACCLEV